MPRLLHELAVGRGDGSYARLLTRLAKLDLLAIDDWMIAPLRDAERRDVTEVIEDRGERASTGSCGGGRPDARAVRWTATRAQRVVSNDLARPDGP